MMDDTTIASKTFYTFILPLKSYLVLLYSLIDLMTEKTSDIRLMHNLILSIISSKCNPKLFVFGFGLKLLQKQLFFVHLFAHLRFLMFLFT